MVSVLQDITTFAYAYSYTEACLTPVYTICDLWRNWRNEKEWIM